MGVSPRRTGLSASAETCILYLITCLLSDFDTPYNVFQSMVCGVQLASTKDMPLGVACCY